MGNSLRSGVHLSDIDYLFIHVSLWSRILCKKEVSTGMPNGSRFEDLSQNIPYP